MKLCAYCRKFRSDKCPRWKDATGSREDREAACAPWDFICGKPYKERYFEITSFVECRDETLVEQVIRGGHPMFAVWNGKVVTYHYTHGKYRPVLEDDAGDVIRKSGIVRFPTEATEYGSTVELLKEIRDFIHRWVELPIWFEIIATYWTLATYIYDRFSAVMYLRFKGDFGTGKSRACKTIGIISYKPTFLGGATNPAPMYRITTWFNGTMIIPEGDIYGDYASDKTQVYNQGSMKDEPVIRCDTNDPNKLRGYITYCPKILGTRSAFPDKALESRCLTVLMHGKVERDDIPILLPPEFYQESLKLRNKLLMWRFKNYHKVNYENIVEIEKKLKVEDRIKQVSLPIFAVTDDETQIQELIKIVEEFNERLIEERGQDIEGYVLDAIAQMIDEGVELWLDDLRFKVNENRSTRDQLSPQKLGKTLTNLGIQTMRKRRTGKQKRVISTGIDELKRIFAKYGVSLCPSVPSVRGGEGGKSKNKKSDSIDVLF